MKRVPEKEIVDEKEKAFRYARAMKKYPLNEIFIDYIKNNRHLDNCRILDLGCGGAVISVALAKSNPKIKEIIAVDASQEMINYAKKEINALNLDKKIKAVKGKLPGFRKTLKTKKFDIIFSKYLLHHLPNPLLFWQEIKKLSAKGETAVFVWDLIRPGSEKDKEKIISRCFDLKIKNDFSNSLSAAFTVDEVKEQLKAVKLDLKIKKFSPVIFLAEKLS